MKKTILLFLLILLFALSGCKASEQTDVADTKPVISDSSVEPVKEESSVTESDTTENTAKTPYIGDYEQESVYQKIKQIEDCKDPDVLCLLLSELYGEEFYFVEMPHKSTSNPALDEFAGYEEPYNEFICSSLAFFDTSKIKSMLGSDTYVFFKPYNETPSFLMDCDATYIVSEYEIKNFDDGTHAHCITSWVLSDLYMCLHQYINDGSKAKDMYRDAVQNMDFYMEFENLVLESI